MSAHKQENVGAAGGRGHTTKSDANDKAQSARKRTKTGCLTCRKRRIKCDEGKPVCKNCQKSKRQCEGYNTRVVFKPADFTYLPHGAATITFDAGFPDAHGENIHHSGYPQQSDLSQRSLSIASQPSFQYNGFDHGQSPPLSQSQTPHVESPVHGMQHQTGRFYNPSEMAGTPFTESHPPFPYLTTTDQMPSNPAIFQHDNSPFQEQFSSTPWQSFEQPQYNPTLWSNSYTANDQIPFGTTQPWQRGTPEEFSAQATPLHQDQANYAYVPNGQGIPAMDQRPKYGNGNGNGNGSGYGRMPSSAHLQAELGSTGVLDDAAIEVHDEDYYDVDSEDEMHDVHAGFDAQTLHNPDVSQYGQSTTLMNQLDAARLDTRYFDTFVFNGALDTYRPEHVANPLKNAATARVFAHFISETAVILTTSPRKIWRLNPAASNKSNQLIRNDIWTSSLAMAALHHQGLLQSMLAISSLQIAKIQGASETPSLKHYAYALKRIHNCVGNPKKRLSVPVLAASLLLGYYEVMAANHANWQSHVTGARHLVVETDFVGMTRMFRQLKMEKARQTGIPPKLSSTGVPRLDLNQSPQDLLLDQMLDTDESTVSVMCGLGVNYGSYGHVGEANTLPNASDLEKYDILRDLYWWYCKQDVYHSLISTDPLMMDYSRYTDCPPRAPLGRPDAPYGSLDHLMLLIARIADFAVKDRKRKLRVERVNAGSPHPDGRRTSNVSATRRQSDSPHMPYSHGQSQSPASTTSHSYDSIDLNIATANALQEWNSIRQALDFFTKSLGPYFQPLDTEIQPTVNTPFGPALIYRTWDLSVFWANYNMAMLAALRNHPNMPAAAHVAAAAAAEQTKPHALAMGQLAAGIVTPPEGQHLDPKMGAAMIDMIIPLFFAGIQYMDPSHRNWLVERLFETTRRTGWATASIIAEGCQSGWIRAAEAGRGPPHVRVRKATFSDFRIGRYGSNEVASNQGRVSELDAENDRKFVRTKASARVHWAIGLMGTEEDVPEDSE